MKKFFYFLLCYLPIWVMAQVPTQTIKGLVLDIHSATPIFGATVFLADSSLGIGTQTDESGAFRLEKVPVGRQTIVVQSIGYEDFVSRNMIVTSGKEIELNVLMNEKIVSTKEVIITADKPKDKPVNDFATVSTRSFNIEQVQRFPGTINDPGRMAMAFPGVQASRDNNNDIVIRGNSPVGLLWRLEGIDIANPNHFARKGSTGGGITIFSLSLMAESDFSTGAFAPEYGNALSGVFDMKFRKGNMDKYEFTGRIGLIGLDLAAEGPIQKGKSSFLVNYRYSTLGILNKMGFHLVGKRVNNTFQDLSFNLHFKTSPNTTLTVFGIGGISSELTSVQSDSLYFKDSVGNPDVSKLNLGRDYRNKNDFLTNTGSFGVTLTHLINEKSFIRAVAVASASHVIWRDDTLSYLGNWKNSGDYFRVNNESYLNGQYAVSAFYSQKVNARLNYKTGFQVSNVFYNVLRNVWSKQMNDYQLVQNGKGSVLLIQPYYQARYRATEKLTFTGGLHGVFLTFNNTGSLEPRLAMNYNLNAKQSLSLAYGLHSQIQPIGNYFTAIESGTNIYNYPNKSLKLTKAHHLVAGYNHVFEGNFRVKTEAYYQYLFNLPVAADSNSTYTPLNDRDGYSMVALVNKGVGRNMGLDVTIEKFFSNKFFFLLGGAIYDAKYRPLNGKWYNMRYNGRYNTSLMAGKEFYFKKGGVIETGFRAVYSGGMRYTPGDLAASKAAGYFVPIDSLVNSKVLPNYFRTDVRVAYRWNAKKYSSIVALDIQNVTNRKNYSTEIYNANLGKLQLRQQATLTPVISWMIDF